MKRITTILSCFAIVSGGALHLAAQEDRPPLMYVADFEAGNSLNRLGDTGIENTLRKVARVTDPVRYGNRSLRVTLDRLAEDDPKAYRTDFWIRGMGNAYQMDEEYWFGFSTFLPEDFEMDPLGELFVQWINPDIRASPSLAIYIYQDTYQIRKRWGERNVNTKTFWRGEVWGDLGQWTDWVVRVLWSDGPDGIVEVWKNGQLIASEVGPNTDRAGDRAPYFKFGIYKWPWRRSMEEAPSPVTQRVMYFDEIRIGNAEAGFDGVAPPMRQD